MSEPTPNPYLLQVPLYIAGKSPEEAREALGLNDVLKLASNENPLGPSPMAVAALQGALAEAHRYPGIAERDLRRRLAIHLGRGLSENHFIIGNGATDVLRMIAQTFIFGGGETVACRVSFPLFGLLPTMFGGKPILIDPAEDYSIDLNGVLGAVTQDTRIVWLCSPNNPTGIVLTARSVEALLAELPQGVVVVMDESYCDYVDDPSAVDAIEHVRRGSNLIAVRSFSKSAGLANLRVGYGIARPELIEYLMHAVLPFNSGAPAIQAASASLDDLDYHSQSRQLIQEERAFLFRALTGLGLRAIASQANFVLAVGVPGGGQWLADQLLRTGVIVRPMGAFGLPDAIRVSVGRREQTERFLAALKGILVTQGYLAPSGALL